MSSTHSLTRRLKLAVAGAAVAGLAFAGSAHAAGEQPVVKPLSVKEAAKVQKRLKRTGKYPPMPLPDTPIEQLELVPEEENSASPAPLPKEGKGVKRIRILSKAEAKRLVQKANKPRKAKASLLGYSATFDQKKNVLLSYVNDFYASVVPGAGGTFRKPPVYELQAGQQLNCGGALSKVPNQAFCWASNWMAWDRQWSIDRFTQIGDTAFAVTLAHEYGHGAMSWMGWANRGDFKFQLAREGFADCMAGGWYYYMHANRLTDSIGRGDGQEFHDQFVLLGGGRTTTLENHGGFDWRYGAAIHGYNYGFDGCVAWGRNIANDTWIPGR